MTQLLPFNCAVKMYASGKFAGNVKPNLCVNLSGFGDFEAENYIRRESQLN